MAGFLLLGACRIVLETEDGGYVLAPDGEILCQEYRTCPILPDPEADYLYVFKADPFDGYRFVGWKEGPGYLCGGKTGDCVVSIPRIFVGFANVLKLSPEFETEGYADLYVDVQGLEGDLYIRQHFLTNWDEIDAGRQYYMEYAVGSTYSLEIDRQPDHQQCTIVNGNGVVTSEADISVSVVCSAAPGRPTISGRSDVYKPFNRNANYSIDVSDPDGDPLSIDWALVRTLGGGDLTFQESNDGRDLVLTGSMPGYYLLKATVSDGTYDVNHFLRVVVENELPFVSYATIPEVVTARDDIEASFFVGDDPEGEDVTVHFDWYINGLYQAEIEGNIMPSGRVKRGDRVQLTVRASDGIKQNWRTTPEIIVADAPLTLSIPDLPESISADAGFSAEVVAEDPDGPASLEIAYGPESLSLNGGTLSWAGNDLSIMQPTAVHFGLRDINNPEDVRHYSVAMTAVPDAMPLVSSSLALPTRSQSLWLGQYDGDAAPELLLTDNINRIMTAEPSGTDLAQDWIYPFSVGRNDNFVHVIGFDADTDGINEVAAITDDALYLFRDRESMAERLYGSDAVGDFHSLASAQIDGDAAAELLILADSALLIIDASTGQLEQQIAIDNGNSSDVELLVGNVDADAGFEAITSSGLVVDLVSGEVQWAYAGGFGATIALGDVNGDGIEEIAGGGRSVPTRLFDANNNAELWSLEATDMCSLLLGDIAGDGGDELVVAGCFSQTVSAYQADLVTATELWSQDIEFVSPNAMLLDDNTGTPQLWLASDDQYRGGLAVIDILGSDAQLTQVPPHLFSGSYNTSGLAAGADASETLVYHSYDDDKTLLEMGLDGSHRFTRVHEGSYNEDLPGAIIDINSDGIDEVLVTTSEFYTQSASLLRLDDKSAVWQSAELFDRDDAEIIAVADFNGDGIDDAAFSSRNQVTLIDIANDSVLWTSPELTYVASLHADDLDGDGFAEIIISDGLFNSVLSVWSIDTTLGGYTQRAAFSTDDECRRVVTAELADPQGTEVICLRDGYPSAAILVLDQALNLLWSVDLPAETKPTDIAVRPDASGESRNVFLLDSGDSCIYGGSCRGARATLQLRSIITGDLIAESPLLLGAFAAPNLRAVIDASGRSGIMLSTGNAAYFSQ